jgi:glycosyltransferase involved in cell wall biosynthesis
MPVRNGERWLAEACRSILCQSLGELELIVIDDGSYDSSPAIVETQAEADRRVRHFRQDAKGLVAALNVGIELARAPLIARLDADDIAEPLRLARQVDYLARNPAVVLLGTWADRIDQRGHRIGRLRPGSDNAVLGATLEHRNPYIHSTVMMRTATVRELGGYRAACEAAEDYDLWLRLSEIGEIAILPETLVRYRWHSAGVSHRVAVRQSFSARIARRAARMRRASGIDPLAGMAGPPDWWAAGALSQFFAEDARLARFLAMAASAVAELNRLDDVELPSPHTLATLAHAEKNLALRAAANLWKISRRPSHLSAWRLAKLCSRLALRPHLRANHAAEPGEDRRPPPATVS